MRHYTKDTYTKMFTLWVEHKNIPGRVDPSAREMHIQWSFNMQNLPISAAAKPAAAFAVATRLMLISLGYQLSTSLSQDSYNVPGNTFGVSFHEPLPCGL